MEVETQVLQICSTHGLQSNSHGISTACSKQVKPYLSAEVFPPFLASPSLCLAKSSSWTFPKLSRCNKTSEPARMIPVSSTGPQESAGCSATVLSSPSEPGADL